MIKNNKLRVLVTGASGMLGTELCKVLKSKGVKISRNRFEITSTPAIKRISSNLEKIDYIIHCAAMTNVNQCELGRKKCFKVNVIGTRNVVNIARKFNAGFIYISTPMVFSGEIGNYKETSETDPINYYSKTKLLGEREALRYNRSLVLRVNPIGVRRSGAHPSFIQWFVDAAENNKAFSLFMDVKINPISTTTLSNMIYRLLLEFKPGILHLGSRDIANKADIWKLIVSKFPSFSGKVKSVSVDETKAGKIAKRPKEMWLNVDKITKKLTLPPWRDEVNLVLRQLGVNNQKR